MGIWYSDKRMDWHEIEDKRVRKNANCIAVICMKNSLIQEKEFSALKVKNFGKRFNLCEFEPFRDQPVLAGAMINGFLVQEDIIATAGHFLSGKNLAELRFVFGYKMLNPSTPVTRLSNENIYKGVKVIHRVYDFRGDKSDWALIKLDRKVEGQVIASLSKSKVFCDQPVYMIGHPAGLPLKHVPGARVREIHKTYFTADLDVYPGNSGSPVFKSDTHEVIGFAVRGDSKDFRWMSKGWMSVIYPNSRLISSGPEFTRVSEFIHLIG